MVLRAARMAALAPAVVLPVAVTNGDFRYRTRPDRVHRLATLPQSCGIPAGHGPR